MITYGPRSHGDTEEFLLNASARKRQLHLEKMFSVPPCLRGVFVAAVAILVAACSTAPPNAPSYDVLITNAQIVDGTGGVPRKGSIAVVNGRIAAVGDVSGTAAQTIDAKGRTVAPGFIDMHSHSDMTLITDGNGQSKIRQGVTTEVIGESMPGDRAQPRHAVGATVERAVRLERLDECLLGDLLREIAIAARVRCNVCVHARQRPVVPGPKGALALERGVELGRARGRGAQGHPGRLASLVRDAGFRITP